MVQGLGRVVQGLGSGSESREGGSEPWEGGSEPWEGVGNISGGGARKLQRGGLEVRRTSTNKVRRGQIWNK